MVKKRREGLGRKEGSGGVATLIEVYAQVVVQKNTILTTHAIWLSSQASLEDSIKLSFSFWMVGQSLCITSKTLTTLSLHCAFSELPQFHNTLNRGNLSFHHKRQMYWICGTTTRSCTTLSSTIGKLNNSISQTSFGLFSCPFLHLCSSITPTFHHIVLTTPSSSFSESCSIPKRCKGASTSLQWFGKFTPHCRWTGSSPKLCWAQALTLSWWSFMCSSSLTSSRGDSICHLACLLFQVMKLLFHIFFVFLARSSLDLRLRLFDPLGSSSPPQVAQSFRQPFATSRVKRVNTKRTKKQREKLKEMMTSLHKRVSRELSVSLNHKKHTIASKPLPKQKNRPIFLGWFWSINSDLQSCSNHANKTSAFAHFSWWRVLSSAIRSPWQDMRSKKRRRKMKIKNKEMKREKKWLSAMFFFWRTIDGREFF